MALLKNFSDIEKYVRLLNPNYQKQLLEEYNFLLEQFIEKQNEVSKIGEGEQKVIGKAEIALNGFTIKAPPRPSPSGITRNSADINNAIKNIQSSFGKNTNTIATNQTSFKSLEDTFVSPIKTKTIAHNKKESLSIFDCFAFIILNITDLGKEFLNSNSSNSEIANFIKQIDGYLSMKQFYMKFYSSLTPGEFLEKVFEVFKDRYITFSLTNPSYVKETPTDTKLGDFLISLQYINREYLDQALQFQKEERELRNQKIMIGDALLSLRLINEEQLYKALYLQKWFKYIITNL